MIFLQLSQAIFKYILYSLSLLELGMRWAPAFIDDYTELEFIQRQEQISADNRGYFIGGISYEALESYSEAEGKIQHQPLSPHSIKEECI